MPNEAHLALVERWMERVHEVGLAQAALEIAAPGLELENPDAVSDIDGLLLRFGDVATAFPDAEATVEEVISDGDRLVLIVELSGTHLGPMRSIPATGRPVKFNTAFVMDVEGDQVRRIRSYPEFFNVMEQIGAFPPPGTTALPDPDGSD